MLMSRLGWNPSLVAVSDAGISSQPTCPARAGEGAQPTVGEVAVLLRKLRNERPFFGRDAGLKNGNAFPCESAYRTRAHIQICVLARTLFGATDISVPGGAVT